MLSPFIHIGLSDIIDIGFVAVLLYAAIVWFRRTRADLVVLGIFILGGIYILARQLQLQLTAWLFQGFFAVFLIIIVVIFQEELRQIFERIALWSLKRRGGQALQSEAIDTLVGTLADFAKDRIGALIVIRGTQPLERHIHGGIELEGKLSEPLLKSIFDPHSPGHDGAVIVERGRLSRYAAQLPLSKDFEQLSKVGTRHSAALGLAELTDALCLVVSEERGRISVATDGRLRGINNFQELGWMLQDFLNKKYPSQGPRKLSIQFFRKNWVEKAMALTLAMGLWYIFVPGSLTAEATYKIAVQVENLPRDLVLDGVEPPKVQATFTGLRRTFYLFDRKRLEATIDVSLAGLGRRTFRISEQNLSYPKDFTLKEVTPSKVKISVRKIPVGNKAEDKGPEKAQTKRGKEG